jgi:hypothetical protein
VRFPSVAALGLVVALPVAGVAEDESTLSLAERAERARGRKGPAPKVLTNDDLRKARGTVTVLPEPEASPATEPGTARDPQATPAAPRDASPAPAPTPVPRAAGEPVAGVATPAVSGDPASMRAAIEETTERAVRYRRALQDAENELRVGGDRLGADRRAALTKFLIDGRRELTRAEQSLAELHARQQGPAARQ